MSEFYILLLIIIISVPVILLVGYILEINNNDRFPVIKTKATLVNKSVEKVSRSFNSYYLIFEISTHKRLKLKVSHDKYATFIEGDEGTLTYQGNRFIYFIRITD